MSEENPRREPSRYRQHLRHGWPLVLNLVLITLVEQFLANVLHFSTTPLDRIMPPVAANQLWHTVLWLLVATAFMLYLTGHTVTVRQAVFVILGVFTLGLVLNVFELALPSPSQVATRGSGLLADGLLIWVYNVLLFAVWYWLLDGGGHMCRIEGRWAPRDFLFPPQATTLTDYPHWHPQYLDYLFLAFTTGTAFGPTDTQTLSRRGKAFQMCQSAISLVVVTVVLARAINNLTPG
ncbi:MAG TPA: hypothetical protein VII06_39260 [Chloroflexota bacterium]|jgi:uncharacterized membrane protein